MNSANQISFVRILSAFLFMLLMNIEGLLYSYLALLVFIIGAISDIYDGKIARERGIVTNLGKIIDPLADKILVTIALILLVQESIIPAWMAILIISREFIVMGLRTLASMEQKLISSDKFGKYKTTAQLIAIITTLVLGIFKKTVNIEKILQNSDSLGNFILQSFIYIPYYFMLIAVVISVASGVNYFLQNKDLFSKDY